VPLPLDLPLYYFILSVSGYFTQESYEAYLDVKKYPFDQFETLKSTVPDALKSASTVSTER